MTGVGFDVPKSKLCVALREARNVVVGKFFFRFRFQSREQRSSVSRESAFPYWKEEIVFEDEGVHNGAKDSPARTLKALGQRNVRIADELLTLEVTMYRKSKWGADHEVGMARLDLSELRAKTKRAENWFVLRQKGQQSRIVGGNDEASTPEVLLWLEFRHTQTERQWYRRNLHDAVLKRLLRKEEGSAATSAPVVEGVMREQLDEEEEEEANHNGRDLGYGGAGFYESKAPLLTDEMFIAYRDATTTFYEDTRRRAEESGGAGVADAAAVAPIESVYNRDWEINELLQFNSRFQQAVQVLNSDAWENAPNQILSAARSLITVSQDFLFSARTYGKVIISERFLPDDKKTIKPLPSAGGKIGGIKYVHAGVFYKFALPDGNIVTSVEDAAKVAGHELRGCMCYYNCAIPGLAVPLMCLIDYKGFRLIAITVLPIDRHTLVGGTSDAGRNIHSSDFLLNQKLAKAGQVLNLKQHQVRGHTIYSACDLEGHFNSKDGRHYLLDFSRVMPPAAPPKQKSRRSIASIFVRMLRPEFVSKYRVPLCSDAFSGFRDKSSKNRDERDIIRACRDLSWLVPRFAAELSEFVEQKLQDPAEDMLAVQQSLSRLIHSKGINMRLLGALFSDATAHSCRMLLLIEMTSRAVKVYCRKRMRELMESLTYPLEQPYIEAVVQILNSVFGGDASIWRGHILPYMANYFGVHFGDFKDHAAEMLSVSQDKLQQQHDGGGQQLQQAHQAQETMAASDLYDDLGSSQGSLSSSGVSEKKSIAPRKPVTPPTSVAPPSPRSSASAAAPAASAPSGTQPHGDDDGEDDGEDQPAAEKSSLFSTLRNVLRKKPDSVAIPPTLPVVDNALDPAPALPPKRIDDPFTAIHNMPGGTSLLLMRIVTQLGLFFSDRVSQQIQMSLARRQSAMLLTKRQAFDVSDLQELGERIKPLNIIPEAQGYVFVHQAKQHAITVNDELHYYHLAIGCFNEALAGNTISKSVLRAYANVLVDMEGALGHGLDASSSTAKRIAELYSEALRIDETDWIALRQYGVFLAKCGLVEDAKLAFLQSIYHNSNNQESVQRYCTLMQGSKEAEEMFEAWKKYNN